MADGANLHIADRRMWEYFSSYPIEELELHDNGRTVPRILFKDLSPGAMLDLARAAKIESQCDPLREIEVYRDVLSPHGISAPKLMAWTADPAAARYWLFLEKIDGTPLWQVGDLAVWQAAAKWLGKMHSAMAGHVRNLLERPRLMRYDGAAYHRWIDRALGYAAQPNVPPERSRKIHQLAKTAGDVAALIDALPQTFVHGEFYASNVMIEKPAVVRPVDWEMAGVGPGLIDLAALSAGQWTDDQRRDIVGAYRESCTIDYAEFDRALIACRLFLAVHCLAWSPAWSPPKEHACDWLEEAIRLTDALGF